MRFVQVFVAVTFASAFSVTAAASPPANSCDRTMEEVDRATTIVLAKAKSVSSTRKDSNWIVRVTYAVDQALVGKKIAEIVVEDTCDFSAVPQEQQGYPGVARHCTDRAQHQLPGLTTDGKPGPSTAALVLVEGKSDVDGTPVQRVVHGNKWSPCADEPALLKKRPALKDLVAKVTAANTSTTFGLVPPPPSPAPSVSASSAATAAPSASSVTTAAPSSSAPPAAPAPPKSGGCSSAGASTVAVWPALVVLAGLVTRRRRRAS